MGTNEVSKLSTDRIEHEWSAPLVFKFSTARILNIAFLSF
jgi:hypothetical protein